MSAVYSLCTSSRLEHLAPPIAFRYFSITSAAFIFAGGISTVASLKRSPLVS